MPLTPKEREELRNLLKYKSNIETMFRVADQKYNELNAQITELMKKTPKDSILEARCETAKLGLESTDKLLSMIELAFLNNAETQSQVEQLTNIISKIDIKSDDIRKQISELQNQIKKSGESSNKNLGLLSRFPFDLASFEINTGIFKGHFERKNSNPES